MNRGRKGGWRHLACLNRMSTKIGRVSHHWRPSRVRVHEMFAGPCWTEIVRIVLVSSAVSEKGSRAASRQIQLQGRRAFGIHVKNKSCG